MEFPEKGLPLLLVDAGVLPEVFGKVLEAKEHLQSGRAATAARGGPDGRGSPAAPFISIRMRFSLTTRSVPAASSPCT